MVLVVLYEPLMSNSLARQAGVTLWRQILAAIEQEIGDGSVKPGDRLPTEAQYSTRFGVNRHTVRRAMEELSRNGLIRVEQGRGAFVAEDVLDYTVGARTRFSEQVRRHNKEPSGRVLRIAEVPADKQVAAALGLRSTSRVVLFERLGLADGRPVTLGRHHFPLARLRGIAEALRRQPTITAALAEVGVDDYRRRITRVTARMPTAMEADLLQVPRTRPVLVTENVNVDRAGAVMEFGVACYPTPRVQIVFEP